jgi:hypothetical protein
LLKLCIASVHFLFRGKLHGQILLAPGADMRFTRFSQDASRPDVRLSYDEDFSSDVIQVTEEQDSAHDGTFVETRKYAAPRALKDVTVSPASGARTAAQPSRARCRRPSIARSTRE